MFHSLNVKALAKNQEKYPKQFAFVFIWSMVTFNLKLMSSKYVFTSNITFINLYNLLLRLKSQEKDR